MQRTGDRLETSIPLSLGEKDGTLFTTTLGENKDLSFLLAFTKNFPVWIAFNLCILYRTSAESFAGLV